MKIGFIGAGGTGKTTVINELKDLGYPLFPSVARSVFKARGITEADQWKMSPLELWDLQKTIFQARINVESQMGDDYIADRTLLDNYCYCLNWCDQALKDEDIEWIEEHVIESLKTYDLLFYFPVEEFYQQNDGFRIESKAYAYKTDALMRGLIERLDIRLRSQMHWMYKASPEQRANRVRFLLQRAKGE